LGGISRPIPVEAYKIKEDITMNKNKTLVWVLGLILAGAIVLAGCAGLNNEDSTPTAGVPAGEGELSEEEIIQLVKEDLAEREGVDVDEIGHPSVEEKTWSDTSLGCPEEGMMYAEVLTPGYQILLSIGGPASIEQFDYRTDMMGNFVLCEQ